MFKFNKIENDSKNILVNDAVMPALFVATAIGDLVRIVSTQRLVQGISSHGIHYSLIEINGEACESANDAVRKLNAFIGSFKTGGGGVSPEDLNNLNNKDVAIYDNGEFKHVTLKDLDKDYHGFAADTYVDQKILEAQQRSFEFQGSVDAFDDLPADPKLGDVYYVTADDTDYYWNGTEWKAWQPEVDLSEYYKTTEVDTLLASKADNTPTFTEATSRTNIATGDSAVTMWGKIRKFFTDLKAVAFSGSYNDLTDKPNIDFQLNVEQKMGYKFLGQDVYAKLVKAVSPDVSSTGRGYSTAVTINEAAFFVNAHGFSTGDTVSSAYSQMVGYIKRTGGHRGNAATTSIEEAFSLEFGYGTTNRYLWVNWSTGYSTYMSGVQTAYIIVYYTKVMPVLP
jgi:hypothetical protein